MSVAAVDSTHRIARATAAPLTAGAGLAAGGAADVGPLRLDLPALFWNEPSGARPEPGSTRIAIELSPRAGRRMVALRQADGVLRLDFPIPTPEISGVPGALYEAASRVAYVHWPLSLADWRTLESDPPGLVALANARTLLAEGESLVRAVGELRERLGPGPVLWGPRVALPHRLALLVWLGFDALDTTEGQIAAARGEYLDSALGSIGPETTAALPPCDCPACAAGEGRDRRDRARLTEHAETMFRREFGRVRFALGAGRLRELVEGRLPAEPLSGEVLRHADRWLGALLEERTPVVASGDERYVLKEAHRRPEVRRFVTRFLLRYAPPPAKRVLLLVPCSKTKPYRRSPTHRAFARALEGLPGLERLHVVSVTSPLGLVPRELEDAYPANRYDIPVTGEWDEDERTRVRTALAHLLAVGRYSRAIVHLDPVEYRFLLDPLERSTLPVVWTLSGEGVGTRSAEALRSLRTAVVAAEPASFGAPPGGPLAVVREELEAIARVQFGADAAARLFAPPVRLAGRPWFQRLTSGDGKTDLATWRDERGWFQLTVAGGERLRPGRTLWVDLAPGFALAGDLFAPGVRDADPAIRPGDAVVLERAGVLVGVGEAAMPGSWMTRLDRGRAVIVRHRVRADRAASPTET